LFDEVLNKNIIYNLIYWNARRAVVREP
jgi:hypothetical protein